LTLKAKSTSKTDIRIVIHDTRINQQADLGFSIKSRLGGDSTLLNAGKPTNFIFEVKNCIFSKNDIEKINNIESRSKIKDRLHQIIYYGGKLKFLTLEKDVFKNNLILIDSLLPNILAEIVYSFYTSKHTTIKDLVEEITHNNPLKYDTKFSHAFYEYKIKRFLTDVALGMTPGKVWLGKYDATGGYLVVKENGDVLCYHIYNRNNFEDYLLNNTKLETASSTRHEFGKIFEKDEVLYFKLNLQIRFI
jgi:type II restriction enzyme